MKYSIILSILTIIMVMGLASATIESIGTSKQNDCISLVQQNAGVTYETLASVQLPDKSFQVINTNMTPQGSGFYNYSFCNTSQIGLYLVNGFDTDNSWNYYFYINPNGEENTLQSVLIQLFASISTLILMVLFLYLSNKNIKKAVGVNGLIENEESNVASLFFLGLSFVFLIAHLILTNSLLLNVLGNDFSSSYNYVIYAFFTIIIFLFLYILTKVIFMEVNAFKKRVGLSS